MAHPVTVESKKLEQACGLVDSFANRHKDPSRARLSLLEAVACRYSGMPVDVYRTTTGYDDGIDVDEGYVDGLVAAIDTCGVPTAMALSSLARIEESEVETKRNGAVYTDFRLAKYLAVTVASKYTGGPIIDPSCGTSIVLAACAGELGNQYGGTEAFVIQNLYGIDLSPLAIRGSLLALATYVRDETGLRLLVAHFACKDSLELGSSIPGFFGLEAFGAVVGNPPWERVRPSRNEFAREHGVVVDYGTELSELPAGYEQHRDASRALSTRLSKAYGLKGGMDLYRAFLNLSIGICAQDGCVALYLPAGLIRSKSLAPVRSYIVSEFREVGLSVFMNHARYFAIDSRFKFVLAVLGEKRSGSNADGVHFCYCTANDDGVIVSSELMLDKTLFNDVSGELGAPEVKTEAEAETLKRIWQHAERMANHKLFGGVQPVRELDMTLDKHLFKKREQVNETAVVIPLIEGRMVSQYRCGCKEYLSGAGRSAKWGAVPVGSSRISPQFYVEEADLEPLHAIRMKRRRIGFCDIAGQTNERAMQAAFVPAGCACGNKVPTLLFDDDDAAMLWLGVANSFVFDWIVRRYITTTINFFILENLPFPSINLESVLAQSIIGCVRRITEMENGDDGWGWDELWAYALERANLDALEFDAYGLNVGEMDTILADFPLVDQVNARLTGGLRPTIQLVRAHVMGDKGAIDEVKNACVRGAMPYVPNEHMRSMLR